MICPVSKWTIRAWRPPGMGPEKPNSRNLRMTCYGLSDDSFGILLLDGYSGNSRNLQPELQGQ